MGHILHDWDLPTKKMLISKAFDAVRRGALIVYEAIIDDERSKNAFGLMMSLNMLIETPAGFDYTGADCADWMRRRDSHPPSRAACRTRFDGGWIQVVHLKPSLLHGHYPVYQAGLHATQFHKPTPGGGAGARDRR